MNDDAPRRIGLISGTGDIPLHFVRKAAQEGHKIVSIAFCDETHRLLEPYVEKSYSIPIGRGKKIFSTLKGENIKDLLILGKVEKKNIFKLQLFDLVALKMLVGLKTHQDKTVMDEVIRTLENEGFHVLDQMSLLGELFPGPGLLARRKPSKQEMADLEFGLPVAKNIADQEIGQTLVIKKKTVIAVEAMEGTDKTIERGCELAGVGCVVVKASRTEQDYRFDSPGIGPRTIEALIKGGATALGIEAGRIMIIDLERVLDLADEADLAIVSM